MLLGMNYTSKIRGDLFSFKKFKNLMGTYLCVHTRASGTLCIPSSKEAEGGTRFLGTGVTVDLSHLIWMLGTKPRTQNKKILSQSTPATVTHSPMMSHTLSQAQSKKAQGILFPWIGGFTCLYKSNSKVRERTRTFLPSLRTA